MKINKLLVGLVFSSIIFLGSLSGEAQAKTNLTMAAMGQTSDTYMIAMGWSNVLNKTKSEVSISPLEGGGVVMLARGMAQGKWDIGFISTPHYLNALEGKGDLSPELRTVRKAAKREGQAGGGLSWDRKGSLSAGSSSWKRFGWWWMGKTAS